MFVLKKEFRFEAAHRLPHHNGKCSRLHGHSWRGWVRIKGDKLKAEGSETGMLMDFGSIAGKVGFVVDGFLDHHYLNETLLMENPTSENVARWVFGALKTEVPGLISVEIEETCTSSCLYEP